MARKRRKKNKQVSDGTQKAVRRPPTPHRGEAQDAFLDRFTKSLADTAGTKAQVKALGYYVYRVTKEKTGEGVTKQDLLNELMHERERLTSFVEDEEEGESTEVPTEGVDNPDEGAEA